MSNTVSLPDNVALAEKRILDAGKRVTDKRCKMLAMLLSEPRPISAYEITDKFNQVYNENVVANSVYRILDWLAEGHFVHKLATINKYVACHHTCCEQHTSFSLFMICQKCQKAEEYFASEAMINEITSGANVKGFPNLLPHIELTGICAECQAHSPS